MKFIKHSQHKIELGLLPAQGILDIAEIATFGSKKYPANNWIKCKSWKTYYDALQRHLLAWWSGEDLDPETGKSHLAHAGCNIAFLQQFEHTHREYDDRLTSSRIKQHKGVKNAAQ